MRSADGLHAALISKLPSEPCGDIGHETHSGGVVRQGSRLQQETNGLRDQNRAHLI